MPQKIEGTTNTEAEVVVIKEDDWSVERNETFTMGGL
jgi:hypothetical protein